MHAAALHACEFTSTSPAKFAGNHHDNNVFIGRLSRVYSFIGCWCGDTPPNSVVYYTAHAAAFSSASELSYLHLYLFRFSRC